MYLVEFKGLQMSFTEYFNLPLIIQKIINDGCDEISKIKIKNLEELKLKKKKKGR